MSVGEHLHQEPLDTEGDDFTIGSCRARFCHVGETVLQEAPAPILLVLVNQLEDIPVEVQDAQVSRLTTGGNPTRVVCGVEKLSVIFDKNLAIVPTNTVS